MVLMSDKVYEQQHPYKLHTVALKLQQGVNTRDGSKERKGNEEYLYSAFLHQGTHKTLKHGSQFYLQITPCLLRSDLFHLRWEKSDLSHYYNPSCLRYLARLYEASVHAVL